MKPQDDRTAFEPEQIEKLLNKFRELASRGFPHRCSCGRVYENLEEFLARTTAPSTSSSGMVASMVGEGAEVVDLFRNCVCGSTIMTIIPERRDFSPRTRYQRRLMQSLMNICLRAGVGREKVHSALRLCIQNFRQRHSEAQQQAQERELLESMLEVCAGFGVSLKQVWRELGHEN